MVFTDIKYDKVNEDLQKRIIEDRKNHWENPYAFRNENAERRDNSRDRANLWRPTFVRDTEKILHLPYYNRYADKTQVFSFTCNDDITRRALHVQLVSRIARNIGAVLGLNLDLIEAIALGHDIGHTPFGHAGERMLNDLYNNETGRFFNHNVHSVRVLDRIFRRNLTLQTLDGIICHNGEFEQQEYKPDYKKTFEKYDGQTEDCYKYGVPAIKKLIPMTLEGCTVRICDMIAYIGKDRQDAVTAGIVDKDYEFKTEFIGTNNAKIINNLTVDIINNSYGKDYIALSENAYNDLVTAKSENYKVIYQNDAVNREYDDCIKPMFEQVYYRLLDELKRGDKNSFIFRHHIDFINSNVRYYGESKYSDEEPNDIVTDYIASMTDDYFLALYKELFPKSPLKIEFKSYFDDIK